MYIRTGDVLAVQDFLCHKKVTTTQKYIHPLGKAKRREMVAEEKGRAYTKYSVLAKKPDGNRKQDEEDGNVRAPQWEESQLEKQGNHKKARNRKTTTTGSEAGHTRRVNGNVCEAIISSNYINFNTYYYCDFE